MLRYEPDDYVREHVPHDAVNASFVASWRVFADAEDQVEGLFLDLHNGWCFDSRCWNGNADAPGRLLLALRSRWFGRCRHGLPVQISTEHELKLEGRQAVGTG